MIIRDISKETLELPIITNQAKLRKITKYDLNDLTTLFSQQEVMEAVGTAAINNKEEVKHIMVQTFDWFNENFKYELAICNKITNKLIGILIIKMKQYDKGVVEIGYLLRKEYWNRGITTECVRETINMLKSINREIKVVSKVNVNNYNSRRVLEKAQMIKVSEKLIENHMFEEFEYRG